MIRNRTVTFDWAVVPLFVNFACGVNEPAWIVEPLTGLTNVAAAISLAAGGLPANSSAPMSGVVAFLVSASMSVVTPTAAPPDSSLVAEPAGICRSTFDVNGGSAVVANEALSFVPAADRVLV